MVWDSRCLVGNVGFGDEAVCMPVSSIQASAIQLLRYS